MKTFLLYAQILLPILCSEFLSVENDLNKINTDLSVSKRFSDRQLHDQIKFLASTVASMIDVVQTKFSVLENFTFNYSAQQIMSLQKDFIDFEKHFDIRVKNLALTDTENKLKNQTLIFNESLTNIESQTKRNARSIFEVKQELKNISDTFVSTSQYESDKKDFTGWLEIFSEDLASVTSGISTHFATNQRQEEQILQLRKWRSDMTNFYSSRALREAMFYNESRLAWTKT